MTVGNRTRPPEAPMLSSLYSLLPAVLLFANDGSAPCPAGYLMVKSSYRGMVQLQAVPYEPREGDLVFYDDHSKVWTALFALAGTGPPLHMGIVVRKTDGTLTVLEAGPDDTVWVDLRDLVPRLHQFRRDFDGTITIRRCKAPLNRFQSAALTRFATAQNGKRYAVVRLLAQGTPLRGRGPLESLLGKTRIDRDSWICSEISVAGATVAGLVNPNVVHSNVAYPRDLVNNERYDLAGAWHDAAEWRPTPPARRP
jgi:hypothetical protein